MPQPNRIDPYTLVFGADSIDDRLFPPIAEEAAARDVPLDDPDRFLFLSSVGRLLQAIAGDPDAGGAGASGGAAGAAGAAGAGAPGAPGGAETLGASPQTRAAQEAADVAGTEPLKQYGRLLYHAFQHWRGGKRTAELPEDRVRRLLDEVTTVRGWSLRPPARAGYLRLPRNLVWAAPAPGQRPEPADGFFWSHVPDRDPAPALHVLMTLGVREDRPGFSVVAATGVLDDVPHWAEADGRDGGDDFVTTLPGGELDRLYSVETAAELLKLASLAFWDLDPARG